jgi:hypothetical protein
MLLAVVGNPICTPYEMHDSCEDTCYLSYATKEYYRDHLWYMGEPSLLSAQHGGNYLETSALLFRTHQLVPGG